MMRLARGITVGIKYNSKLEEDISNLEIKEHALVRFMERAGIFDPGTALEKLKELLGHVYRHFQRGEECLYRSETEQWQIIAKRSYKNNHHVIVTLFPAGEQKWRH